MADPISKSKAITDYITNVAVTFSYKVAEFSVRLLKGEIKEITNEVVEKLKEKAGEVEENQWLTMLSAYKSAGMISESDVTSYYKMKDLAHPFDWVMYFAATIKLFFNYITVTSEGHLAKQSQAINKEVRPYLPAPADIINAAFIAPEKTGRVREILKRTGIKDEDIDLLFLSKYSLYPPEMIKTLYLRGIIDEGLMFTRMRELGYTDTRIREMIRTWEVIPGAQDLFWMVGKEAFEPDTISLLGLDAEFPVDQVKWLQKQGISNEWALKYWYAHWDQPSIQQGFEMLHRGVIDLNMLDTLFKTVEIPPFWRDKLTKIAYQPLTRVDVRRMHKLGVIDDQRLIRAYKDLGYNDENALAMANFTVLYNQGTSVSLTKSQILSSYKDGMINRDNAKELLTAVDIGESEAEFLLYHEDHKKEQANIKRRIKVIGDRYKLGNINIITVRNELGKLNLLSDKIELLIEEWDIDKYEDIAIPSKTDLNKFLLQGVITKDQYRTEMKKLGYTTVAINWYMESLNKTTRST